MDSRETASANQDPTEGPDAPFVTIVDGQQFVNLTFRQYMQRPDLHEVDKSGVES